MNRRRLLLVVIAVAVAVACVAVVSTAVRGAGKQMPPAAADEAMMRSVITAYERELEPIMPAEFYGRQLTIGPCITMIKTHVQRLQEVATGAGIWPMDTGWLYLAGIKGQIRELHGALPVSWHGRIVSWDVVEGSGDRYVVKATVQQTLHWATWDAAKKRLVRPGSMTYEATTNEYTLERVDGGWKITKVVRDLNDSA
jgi:hypothetical protein